MKRSKPTQKARLLQLEKLQARELMAIDLAALAKPGELSTYSIDGTGNNKTQTEWGSTNEDLLRLAKPEYGDGISTPTGANRPSGREISNVLSDQGDADIISKQDMSAFVYAWGQFIDHDISLTPTGTSESFNIAVPKGDPYFDPAATATKIIGMTRSLFDPSTGTSTANPRQQMNAITAWMDASMIYGSDSATANALRTMSGGKLKMEASGMLPLNNSANFPNGTVNLANIPGGVPDDQLYAAGDVRANENIELTSLHTVFVREHNRWADRIAKLNPKLSDQEIYERARAVVIAEIQSITYNEWLPAVLGNNAMPRYSGYNPRVNPNLSNEFATAAFRFGHSILGDDVEFLDNNGLPEAEEVALKDAFFNPTLLQDHTIESIFKYLASDPASELDTKLVGSVRNFLFGPPGAGGFDLAALNIQRGRDHGLADYNDTRASIGLPKVKSFAEITRNKETQTKLQQLYGTVDNIDLWIGILAEDPVAGGSIGPTGQKIIADQFRRMRDGDRFWYQNEFAGDLLREIDQTRLSDVLKRNTPLQNLQQNVFFFHAGIAGTVFGDGNGNKIMDRGDRGLAGFTVELRNDEGVVATAVTDAAGRYRFDVQSGVRTGEYTVSAVKAPDGKQIKSISKQVAITRGDQLMIVDLAVAPPSGSGQAVMLASAVDAIMDQVDPTKRRR
ncbi:MAG: peroxidase family protein [Pirellulales bacterium]